MVDARSIGRPIGPLRAGAPAGTRAEASGPGRRINSLMVVLGIDPGLANLGFGVVARRGGRLLSRSTAGWSLRRPGCRPSGAWHELQRARRRADRPRTAPMRWRSKLSTSARTCAPRSPSGRRAASCSPPPGRRGVPCLDYTPAAGQGRRLRQRPRGEGPGDRGWSRCCSGSRRSRSPTTRPTRWRSRSATPTTRRCATPQARRASGGRAMIALVAGDVAVRRADHVVRRDVGRRRLPARGLRRDAAPRPGRRAAGLAAHATSSCATTRSSSTASRPRRSAISSCCCSASRASARRSRSACSAAARRASSSSALAAGDVARLQAVPGVGKRTAERIVVELREKVVPDGAAEPAFVVTRGDDPRRLAREGLAGARFRTRRGGGAAGGGRGRERRGAAAERAAGGAPMSALGTTRAPRRRRRASTRPAAARRGGRGSTARCDPRRLEEFVGQEAVRDQLAVSLEAAAGRGEPLDHVLLAGPPGLGKTSLAQIVAAELRAPFVQTAGPALERKGDIAALLTALEPGAVFFVDEIHRLNRALEETFYPAMEDRQLPITIGQGAGARVVTLELPPFTLVGATTRAGLLSTPLRDRFGIQHRLEPYAAAELAQIVRRSAQILDVRARRRRRAGDRIAQPRNAARRQPAAAPRARLGGGQGRRRRERRKRPTPRSRCSRSTSSGSTASTARSSNALCVAFGGETRRPHDARDQRRRGGRHDRGRLRALPAAERADSAHAARPRRDGACVRAPGARPAAAGEPPLIAASGLPGPLVGAALTC